MYRTDHYEGMLAETVAVRSGNGDLINAYFARPLGSGPLPGMVLPGMVLLHHAPLEHALNLDFVDEAQGPGARVAVELTAESARRLVEAILGVLAQADGGGFLESPVNGGPARQAVLPLSGEVHAE